MTRMSLRLIFELNIALYVTGKKINKEINADILTKIRIFKANKTQIVETKSDSVICRNQNDSVRNTS